MRTLQLFAAIAITLASISGAAAQSQITTAVIEGDVIDASGAVLPGVDVEIRNVDTNLTRSLTSDREGRFIAPQLPPGRYTVTLKLSGFATQVQENVLASVGDVVRLVAQMKIGRGRNRDRDELVAGGRDFAHRLGEHAQRAHD